MSAYKVTPNQARIFAAIDASESGVVNIYTPAASYGQLLNVARKFWERKIGFYYACGPLILVARDAAKFDAELSRLGVRDSGDVTAPHEVQS